MQPFTSTGLGNPGPRKTAGVGGPGLLAHDASGNPVLVTDSAGVRTFILDTDGAGKLLFDTSIKSTSYRDTSAAFDVSLVFNSSGTGLSANRIFTLDLQNGNRKLQMAGDIIYKGGTMTLIGTDGMTYTYPTTDAQLAGSDISQTFTGVNTFAPAARSSGVAPYFTITDPADTAITAGTEGVGVLFSGNTRQHASNTTVALQRECVFTAPTYSFATAGGTITTAVTLDVADPVAGTNATLTNKYSLRAGAALFSGIVNVGTTPSIKFMPSQPTGTGGWIDMSTTGSSGIGSGGPGVNPWVAYVSGTGHWFTGSVIGDIAYRNSTSSASMLFGNSGGVPCFTVQNDAFNLVDTRNMTFGTSTGCRLGTATSQKFAFWNTAPIVQPTTSVAAATHVAGVGTAITTASTFDGYTLLQVVKALRNTGLLA